MNGLSNGVEESVSKSYNRSNPVLQYCLDHSSPLHPVQQRLQRETIEQQKMYKMLGAPEVVSLNSLLIKSLQAKKVIDVGVFTGASALAAALALPQDGVLVACDVSEEWTNRAKEYWKLAGVDHKVKLTLAPAAETLQNLLEQGEEGTFDFAFIDADKTNYGTYYELCLQLLRKGGMISIDNTLWSGKVITDREPDADTLALRALNQEIAHDGRVTAVMANIGDGLTLVAKN